MQVISHIPELRRVLQSASGRVFVPTMGNLHDGHLALVRKARQTGGCVIVSIFVNPLQFGPQEDYGRYPRTLEADCDQLEKLGVDVVFSPTEAELFPVAQEFHVSPPSIAKELCGEVRPGFFRGVATIMLKLYAIVLPSVMIFGKKDYQQLHIIRAMVNQFNLPVRVEACETVRARDGLALSSRNAYLNLRERAQAPELYLGLGEVAERLLSGERDFRALETRATEKLKATGWQVDYVAVRNAQTLKTAQEGDAHLVVLAAARLGGTRLIDNLEIELHSGKV